MFANFFPPSSDIDVKSAIVMLHGYGSDGNDMLSMAPILAENLKNDGHMIYIGSDVLKEKKRFDQIDVPVYHIRFTLSKALSHSLSALILPSVSCSPVDGSKQ